MTDTLIATEDAPAQAAADAGVTDQSTAPATTEPNAESGATPSAEATNTAAENQDQGEKSKEENPQGAPEKYEFKAPEGQQYDAPTIDAFSEVAKELNLSQESAQKVLDKMAPVIAERQIEQLEAAKTVWADEAKADKEFGGAKLAESLAVAKQGLDYIGTPELKKLLNETGLGNHPEVIRAFYRAGKAISNDTFVGGKGVASDAKKSAPDILYDRTAR